MPWVDVVNVVIVVGVPLAWLGLWILVIWALNRRPGRVAVVGTVLSLFVLYAVPYWALMLTVFSDDAPAPPESRVPLPPTAAIARTEEFCASGGCWLHVELTPDSHGMDDGPECTYGTILDPRIVCWDEGPGSGAVRYRPLW